MKQIKKLRSTWFPVLLVIALLLAAPFTWSYWRRQQTQEQFDRALAAFNAHLLPFTLHAGGGLPHLDQTNADFTPEQLDTLQAYLNSFRFHRLTSEIELREMSGCSMFQLEYDCPQGHMRADTSYVCLTDAQGQSHYAFYSVDQQRYEELLSALGIDI